MDNIKLEPNITKGENDEDYTLIQLVQPVREKTQREKYLEEKAKEQKEAEKTQQVVPNKKDAPLTKRQKHKLDKIKKKYGDQDEEEREQQLKKIGAQPTQGKSIYSNLNVM